MRSAVISRPFVTARVLRGLAGIFLLSFVNLFAVYIAIKAVIGLGAWSNMQFAGLFGLIEVTLGLAFLIAPNIWRLPLGQAELEDQPAVLTPSAFTTPHLEALGRIAAGVLMLVYVAADAGVVAATAALVAVALPGAAAFLAISVAVARVGVARPDLDVLFITFRRPRHPETALPGFSISGTLLQLVAGLLIFPAIRLLSPAVLYRPELAPSLPLVIWTLVACLALAPVAWLAWRGRMSRDRSPGQRQAEAHYSPRT